MDTVYVQVAPWQCVWYNKSLWNTVCNTAVIGRSPLCWELFHTVEVVQELLHACVSLGCQLQIGKAMYRGGISPRLLFWSFHASCLGNLCTWQVEFPTHAADLGSEGQTREVETIKSLGNTRLWRRLNRLADVELFCLRKQTCRGGHDH